MRKLIFLSVVAITLVPTSVSAQSLYQQERDKIRESSSYDDSPLFGSKKEDDRTCFGYSCSGTSRERTRDEPSTPELNNSFSGSGVPKNSMGNNIINQLQPR